MLFECEYSTKIPDKKMFWYYFSQMWQNIREHTTISNIFSRVHTRNFPMCNAPLRVSPTHSLFYNFYFCHILHHSNNLRQTTHIVPIEKQALLINFILCRIAFTNLSRTALRSVLNRRK
jgi:hypothetical protein